MSEILTGGLNQRTIPANLLFQLCDCECVCEVCVAGGGHNNNFKILGIFQNESFTFHFVIIREFLGATGSFLTLLCML